MCPLLPPVPHALTTTAFDRQFALLSFACSMVPGKFCLCRSFPENIPSALLSKTQLSSNDLRYRAECHFTTIFTLAIQRDCIYLNEQLWVPNNQLLLGEQKTSTHTFLHCLLRLFVVTNAPFYRFSPLLIANPYRQNPFLSR